MTVPPAFACSCCGQRISHTAAHYLTRDDRVVGSCCAGSLEAGDLVAHMTRGQLAALLGIWSPERDLVVDRMVDQIRAGERKHHRSAAP